jgi:hypothetical protein
MTYLVDNYIIIKLFQIFFLVMQDSTMAAAKLPVISQRGENHVLFRIARGN